MQTVTATVNPDQPVVPPISEPVSDLKKGVTDPIIQNPPVVNAGAPVVVKSPLGDQIFGQLPIDQVKLSSFEDVAAFAKDTLGEEIKTVQDFVPFVAKVRDLKEKAGMVEKLQKTNETFKNVLNSLPKDVSLILTAAINGQDYMPIIHKLTQKAVFDFEKPFTAHDSLALVNHYAEKEYTKETFDALDPAAQDALESVAKMRYKADQDEYKNLEVNTRSAAETRQKNFLASVDSSIAQMVANNPRMDKAAVEQVRQIMTAGLQSSLFTPEQTYLPDAAEKIAYLQFGKAIVSEQVKTIGDLVAQTRGKIESETLEKILNKSDKPIPTGGTGNISQNVLQAEVDKATSFLKKKR
jgi:hypothetical protein